MRPSRIGAGVALAAVLSAASCAPAEQSVLLSSKSPVELRAMQARSFDTADRNKVLRAVIATLQDLGYSVDKVQASAGTVTATKLATLHLSASTYPHGSAVTVVRANAIIEFQNRGTQVDDPLFYRQDFFDPLAHTVALQAAEAPSDDTVPAPEVDPVKAAKPASAPTKTASAR